MNNSWNVHGTKHGRRVIEEEGHMDPFAELIKKNGAATVGITVGRAADYGETKVSAFVQLTCDQDEDTINHTGELAFKKALELVNDGWNILMKEGEG